MELNQSDWAKTEIGTETWISAQVLDLISPTMGTLVYCSPLQWLWWHVTVIPPSKTKNVSKAVQLFFHLIAVWDIFT